MIVRKDANVCVECKIKDEKPFPLCPLCQRPFCYSHMPNHVCKLLNYKMTVLVRKDLNMTPGKVAAQVAHAAVELCKKNLEFSEYTNDSDWTDVFVAWDKEGGRVVILGVETEEEILRIERLCKEFHVRHSAYRDGGITEVHPNTLTVLGIGPDLAEKIDVLTREFMSY